MCGIWGLVGQRNTNSHEIRTVVENLFILSESRGKEASGISGLSGGSIISLKMAEPASKLIKKRAFDKFMEDVWNVDQECFALIGHSRLATNGSEGNNENNQPVVTHGISTVHNGIIVNVDQLWNDNPNLNRQTELDTEVFGRMVAKEIEQGMDETDAVKEVYKHIQGTASTLTILEKGRKLIAATNNGSLYCSRSKDKNWIIFASEAYILQGLFQKNRFVKNLFHEKHITHLKPNGGITVVIDGAKAKRFLLDDYAVKHGVSQQHKFIDYVGKYKGLEIDTEAIRNLKRCTKCVLPETFPYIEFDSDGVCNYCRSYKKMKYVGKDRLRDWAEDTKKKYAKREYNSIVSFSGGRDSSYGLHIFVKELGLKPVAYNYDWGMVTDLARRNQARMCAALGVELITVSADIHTKRKYIKRNINAWLRKPDLGMIPLFMAGDKAYFYYANVMKKRFGLDSVLLASNPFETTYFKSGFCGVKPGVLKDTGSDLEIEQLDISDVLKMAGYYTNQYLANHKYFNSSLIDTAMAAMSYYMISHEYFRLFDYIPWEENTVNNVLINEYDWELALDTDSSWRIGDGTAPFYNYIYYNACGFTENDTLRSNQIREDSLEREKAMEIIYKDNQPRWESLEWYFNILGLDMVEVLSEVKRMDKLY